MTAHWLCCTLVATAFLAIAACKGDVNEPEGPQDGAAAHDSGGGDAAGMASDAFVMATIGPGTAGVCSFGAQSSLFEVGVQTGTQPTTVLNGALQSGARVNVTCTVRPDNNGYDVDLFAEVLGQGAMQINSSAPGAVTSNGGTGIVASFTKIVGNSTGQTFTANDCTITYKYQGAPISTAMPVAAGRIWGHISCPDVQSSTSFLLPDGGSAPDTCDAEADFLFENCAE